MSTIEEELRAAFERQEAVVPEAGPLRDRIDFSWVRAKRRRAKRRVLGAAAAVVLAGVGVPVVLTSGWHGGQPDTITADALAGTATPTAATAGEPIDLLLIGGENRPGAKTRRADTIMLLHVPADRSAAWMVSLSRFGLVDVPGKGRQTLTETMAQDGAKATAQAVTTLTGIDFDGAAVVDDAGWRGITEEAGGVTVCLDQAIPPQGGRAGLAKGCQRINGAEVTALLHGQTGLKQASIDRDRNAQRFVAALAKELAADGVVESPVRLQGLVKAAKDGLQIDGDIPMLLRLAKQLKDVKLIGLGESRFNSTDRGEIVDSAQWKSLYQAIRDDDLASWAAANPDFVNK